MAFDNRQELVLRAERLVRNERGSGIDLGDVEQLASTVVQWLSHYAPRVVIDTTFDGTGSAYDFALSALSVAWAPGFSRMKWVEHPIDTQARNKVDDQLWEIYPDPDAALADVYLRFLSSAPANASNNIKICYTTVHTVDDSSSSVPDHHEPAYEFVLAAKVAELKAGTAAHSIDSTIDQDSVDRLGNAGEWREIADKWLSQASNVLGVDLTEPPRGGDDGASVRPASRFKDWDPGNRFGWGHIHRPNTGPWSR